jgi:LysR family transcriptional regulator, hydrogen peroxide-inducible genes activator
MTLTELRYVVALAQFRHFGRAAGACFVSQPTLSIAVRKLEEELGVSLFERRRHEVSLTETGARVVAQAQRVLEEAEELKHLARSGGNALASPLSLGVIYTVGPYLLPHLIPRLHDEAPDMGLVIREGYTQELVEALRSGVLDVLLLALPLDEPGLQFRALYDEPFMVALPSHHLWEERRDIAADELGNAGTVLLLSRGNCFREQVLQACPGCRQGVRDTGITRTLEGSSLETIRHMVASGMGITVLPASAVGPGADLDGLLRFKPFSTPTPTRRIALAWRSSFTRQGAIEALARAIAACNLPWALPCGTLPASPNRRAETVELRSSARALKRPGQTASGSH